MKTFFKEITKWCSTKKEKQEKKESPESRNAQLSRCRRPLFESLEDRCMLATLFVDASVAASGAGASWSTAFKTLQEALNVATSGTEVWIADGTYTPSKRTNVNESRSETFSLINGVSLYGGFAGTESTKDQRAKNPDGTFVNQTILSGDLAGNDDARFSATYNDNSYTVLYGANLTSEV
ncbi:MAG: hypothetical protein ACRC2T_18550, partial [Thermoguttaceae bacterium]